MLTILEKKKKSGVTQAKLAGMQIMPVLQVDQSGQRICCGMFFWGEKAKFSHKKI